VNRLQGLADHALNVVKAMKADGLETSTVVLNSLMNAFGEDRRVVEAFSVLQFMKENVSDDLPLFC
jgi:pentatricopeptide repeat protein